jgi:hypothetical protein
VGTSSQKPQRGVTPLIMKFLLVLFEKDFRSEELKKLWKQEGNNHTRHSDGQVIHTLHAKPSFGAKFRFGAKFCYDCFYLWL